MKTKKKKQKLNRYTTLPVLLDLLLRKKIVFLDPSTWEDKNDTEIILEYKKRKIIPSLFAICFAVGDETIHHWKTYSDGISGCCIEFDKKKFLECFKGIKEIRWGEVDYKKIDELKDKAINVDDIPFTKRWQYRCEEEFRILWEGSTKQKNIDIDIDLTSINRITISQKMPADVRASINKLLRIKMGDSYSKINSSTLYENKKWIKKFKNMA